MNLNIYPIHAGLENPAFCCASLAITQNFENTKLGLQATQPKAGLRNGTVTFVKCNEKHYAITCKHVVESFRKLKAQAKPGDTFSLRTMQNGFYLIIDQFIFPNGDLTLSPPDIAIKEINPALIKQIRKQALDLNKMVEPPNIIQHALATGFPESMKYETKHNDLGHKISLPQVQILAELSRKPKSRFTMRSELENTIQPNITYSGMSGGPIYWSTEDEYGLLGIVYEGAASEDLKSITVFGELATAEVIKRWVLEI